ncbi:MAG: aminopeptidase N [Candidatus Dormibacteria bacterium]
MAAATLTQAEAREREALVGEIAYFIDLDLSRGDDTFAFELRTEFAGLQPGLDTFIEAEQMTIREMVWNGEPLDAHAYDGHRIGLPQLRQRNSLRVLGEAGYEQTGLGLHHSIDPADGSVYIYSDFEPYEAHRCFPCFDQPDLKGSFRLRVRAPQEWVVVATDAGQPEEVDPGDGSRWWGFPPTMPLSPYVLGLAAGPFHQVTGARGSTPLGLYCARSLAAYLDSEELFAITAAGLDYFEGVFGIPYPFSKYDQVFCPEKANGAMESPGCVTVSDSVLWRGRATIQDHARRANWILHEMAHMWFGDLVTMRWWDDLWLNESFATLMAVFAVDRATDFQDAWVMFATENKQLAILQDRLATAHPVVSPVEDAEAVRANFDTIVYEKGAAALRQLVAFVGEEAFFAALRRHLSDHREANAGLADLLQALSEASDRDVRGWSRAWLETVGVNTLRCEVASQGEVAGGLISSAAVLQSAAPHQPTLRPHRIRLGTYDWVGDRLRRSGAVELDVAGPRTEVEELVGQRRPALLLPNDGDLSYAKIRLDPVSAATTEEHLRSIDDALARALLWDRSWDSVRDLELPAHRYARMVTRHLAAESDSSLVQLVLNNFHSATRLYGSPTRAREQEAQMAQVAWSAMADSEPGGDRQLVWLRGFIRFATSDQQQDRCRSLLADRDLPQGVNLDAELRWRLVLCLAQRGAVGKVEVDRALAADPSSSGRARAGAVLASRPTAAAKRAAWAELSRATATLDEARLIAARMGGLDHEELMLPYARRYPELVEQMLHQQGGEFAFQIGSWLSLSLWPSHELVAACRASLARPDLDPVPRRVLAERLEETEQLLSARQLDEEAPAPD